MPVVGDQFFVIDPGSPPASGTALTMVRFKLDDVNSDSFISTTAGDTVGGLLVTSVWVGDQIRVQWPDGSTQWITGVTFYRDGGPAVFTPTDGTVLQNATFLSSTWVSSSTQVALSSLGPTCFVAGTLIDTPEGPRAIETLRPGDTVTTADHGPQTLRWVSRSTARAAGAFAPVRIRAGALGNLRDLWVSQQHRMLLSGWWAELMFGAEEVLVAAKHLLNDHSITLVPGGSVTYLHLMFDQHEIVFAEGIATESYFAAPARLTNPDPQTAEMLALFPELARGGTAHAQTARPVLRGFEAQMIAA